MMMVGRFIGIFVAKKITPTMYAYIDMAIASIVIILLGTLLIFKSTDYRALYSTGEGAISTTF